MTVHAFVQARMTSSRFPGKVLAPLAGVPVLERVVNAVAAAVGPAAVVVATSDERTDDPIAAYTERLGFACFRGPLDDVYERFRLCHADYPCEWILRVNADSPLLAPDLIERVVSAASDSLDLVTTVLPRAFPRGHNVELVRATTLFAIDPAELTPDDREHVTAFLYRHARGFRIHNVESGRPDAAEVNVAVETVDDLRRLGALLESGVPPW